MTTAPEPFRSILVVGATGGIGGALLAEAEQRFPDAALVGWARQAVASAPPRAVIDRVDITDEASIAAAVSRLETVDLVIIATGVLQREADGARPALRPEKTFRALDAARMAESFAINTIAPALIAKHVLAKFPRDRRAVFAALSARVGSIADNRLGGWYSYRASKAALNQLLRTLSIELAMRTPKTICVGLHPGTVDTGLSKPFQANVTADKLFAPQVSARHLFDVIDGLTPAQSGGVYDWAGLRVPE
jgi:NAD(P)-dependent dehydrogenase (short-subunit alcohol dehydrogenase family)